jgi:predicted KAP-like P-loop ATPase
LERLAGVHRVQVLQSVVETGQGLSTIVAIVSALGDQHGKYSGQSIQEGLRLLDIDQVAVLEQCAARRIAGAAETGALSSTPEFAHVLYRWRDWSGAEPVQTWLASYLREERNFLSFLQKLIPDEHIGSGEDPVADLKWRRYLDTVQDFISIEACTDEIERLNGRGDLTKEDRVRLKLLQNNIKQWTPR